MKSVRNTLFLTFFTLLFLFTAGCITQFIPETDEIKELLVVEGIITNQAGGNTIKLSLSLPLGSKVNARPLKGCTVTISDNLNNSYPLIETVAGTYITNPDHFHGVTGRKYTLHIATNNPGTNFNSYESIPMELKSVPLIDTLFHERIIFKTNQQGVPSKEGCQVYLNTSDPEGICKYYRWDYTETWEFQLPYFVPNRVCWMSNNSKVINIKNTSVLSEDRINRYPINFISNQTDRLNVRYSILVNQYSLNEDEFSYWEKLQNITQQVGSLYDITPASVPGNIFCIEDPAEKVLGYFSVSAKASKRIFIDEFFAGLVNLYTECPSDTIYGPAPIPGLNVSAWIIEDQPYAMPPYKVITKTRGCADCSVRGSTIKPDFWN